MRVVAQAHALHHAQRGLLQPRGALRLLGLGSAARGCVFAGGQESCRGQAAARTAGSQRFCMLMRRIQSLTGGARLGKRASRRKRVPLPGCARRAVSPDEVC